MPVSKRNRMVSLTQTKKKGLEHKEKLVNEIRDALEDYDSVYIFSIENMRNNKLKEVREEWKGTSKLIMGKNKVLQIALGRSKENEIADNIHKVSERLMGQCGLLLTSQPQEEVVEWFANYREPDFARAGFVATETVVLRENDLADFSHTMEPQFRRLGLPTQLVNGKIKLLRDFTVCNEGDTLTPEQADVLKHKGIQMADFHVTLEFLWKEDGTYKVLEEKDERSTEGVKKSKAKKRSSGKRAPKRAKKADANDADEDEDEEDDEDDEDDEQDMDEVEEEEEETKKKKEKENRPVKKAKRQSTTQQTKTKQDKEESMDQEDVEEATAEESAKQKRRTTRSSMRVAASK